MILERATDMPVSRYLQEKVWKPLGMEADGSWSLDSKNSGFEKMESGVNARARDFARFGMLFAKEGSWEGRQLISREWVKESTDRKSTRLNSSHANISYAVFCLKIKKFRHIKVV